jgi:subtilase family serine protease
MARSSVLGVMEGGQVKKHSRRWTTAIVAQVLLLGVVIPMTATASASATSTPTAPALNLSQLRTLTSDLLPGLVHAVFREPTAPTTRLTVALGLQPPNASAESNLLAALYDSKSARYHQFLTPSQFDAAFHVAPAIVNATTSWLKSGGLTISYISGAGDLIGVQGTTAEFGALLHTTFGDYSVGNIDFVANQVAPTVPAGLPITAVSGLNTLQRMWTPSEVSELNGKATTSAHAVPAATAAGNYVGSLVPQDLWGAYDAPSSDQGQGETAGMFGWGSPASVSPDLRIWEQRMGLPAVPLRQVLESQVTNPPIAPDNDVFGDTEWNNDVQAISGMAPKLSRLDLYFSSTGLDSDSAIMISNWANDPQGPRQMNASFGECESDPTSHLNPPQPPVSFGLAYGQQAQILDDPSLEQSVLEGRTLFASSGDEAGSCPLIILPIIGAGQGVLPGPVPNDQNYPCASAFAVCVGGTVLTTNGTVNPVQAGAPASNFTAHPARVNEQAWLYGGGGPAANVPLPAYQAGVGAINKPCTEPVRANGTTPIPLGTTCRGTPDVAAMSGTGLLDGQLVGNNGYEVNVDMLPTGVAGTSVSSPLVVGAWARVQAAAPPSSKGVFGGLGFANETFYAVGKGAIGKASRDYYDVTSGDTPIGNFYELPSAGWDYTTGWGVIDIANFIHDVDHNSSATPTHPSANPDFVSFFPQVACSAALTSPIGNAYDGLLSLTTSSINNVALDITSASLAPSADGKSLIATISGPGLSTTGPIDALDGFNFYVAWTYQGTTYLAMAEVNPPSPLPKTPLTNSIPAPLSLPTGTIVYGDGVANGAVPALVHTDTGSFSNHTFTIVVPRANVGNPAAGSVLLYPFAFDTLPFGIFVAFASDEATAAGNGQVVKLGGSC